MKNKSLLIFVCMFSFAAFSQTFNSTTGPVPDNSCTAANDFPINVSGIGVLGTTKAFDQIEINILMDADSDLNISLVTPGGLVIPLAWGQGDGGANFTHTVFRADGTKTLGEGAPPFTGIFYPDGEFSALDGIQADGTWKLRVCDTGPGSTATVVNSTLNFVPYIVPTCAAPSFVYSDNITATSVHFFWDTLDGNANYYYLFNTSPAYPTAAGTPTKATEYTATNLAPETNYYLHVRQNCGGQQGLSKWRKAILKSAPVNDNCTNAIKITAVPYTNTQDILGGNYTDGFVSNCGDGMNDGAWYSFYIAKGGNLKLDLTNVNGWNPELAVFMGSCGNFTCVGSVDANGIRGNESLTLNNLTPGMYFVNIGDGSGTVNNLEGRFSLNVTGTAQVALLGVDSFDADNFSYYPNPVKNKLNLSYTKNLTHASVFNLLGQLVMEKGINANQSEIDMSGLMSGTYFVKVVADNQEKILKVIKE